MSLHLFYEPWSQYIANESRCSKETVSPKIVKNIEWMNEIPIFYNTKLHDYDI